MLVYMKIVLKSFLEEHKNSRFLYIPKFVNAVRFLCKQRYIVPGIWFMVPKENIRGYIVPGVWFMVPKENIPGYIVPGVWFMVPKENIPG